MLYSLSDFNFEDVKTNELIKRLSNLKLLDPYSQTLVELPSFWEVANSSDDKLYYDVAKTTSRFLKKKEKIFTEGTVTKLDAILYKTCRNQNSYFEFGTQVSSFNVVSEKLTTANLQELVRGRKIKKVEWAPLDELLKTVDSRYWSNPTFCKIVSRKFFSDRIVTDYISLVNHYRNLKLSKTTNLYNECLENNLYFSLSEIERPPIEEIDFSLASNPVSLEIALRDLDELEDSEKAVIYAKSLSTGGTWKLPILLENLNPVFDDKEWERALLTVLETADSDTCFEFFSLLKNQEIEFQIPIEDYYFVVVSRGRSHYEKLKDIIFSIFPDAIIQIMAYKYLPLSRDFEFVKVGLEDELPDEVLNDMLEVLCSIPCPFNEGFPRERQLDEIEKIIELISKKVHEEPDWDSLFSLSIEKGCGLVSLALLSHEPDYSGTGEEIFIQVGPSEVDTDNSERRHRSLYYKVDADKCLALHSIEVLKDTKDTIRKLVRNIEDSPTQVNLFLEKYPELFLEAAQTALETSSYGVLLGLQ